MENFYVFITILTIVMLVISLLRMAGLASILGNKPLHVVKAEMAGKDPIGDAMKVPMIIIIVCMAWLISLFF